MGSLGLMRVFLLVSVSSCNSPASVEIFLSPFCPCQDGQTGTLVLAFVLLQVPKHTPSSLGSGKSYR